MRFLATIRLNGKSATGIPVPPDVVAVLGESKRPAVRVTVNGFTFRSTIASMRGEFMLPLSGERREAAGVAAGDEVEVEVELDTEVREVAVPTDLAAALTAVAGAREAFDRLAYGHRKEHVRAIEEAKQDETRRRRIARTVEMVAEGRGRG